MKIEYTKVVKAIFSDKYPLFKCLYSTYVDPVDHPYSDEVVSLKQTLFRCLIYQNLRKPKKRKYF